MLLQVAALSTTVLLALPHVASAEEKSPAEAEKPKPSDDKPKKCVRHVPGNGKSPGYDEAIACPVPRTASRR
jgi:hypothetical protein